MFSSFSREGKGVHSGRSTTVRVEMGKPGSGVIFVSKNREIPARCENISSKSRRATSLADDITSVGTVEHLLSALAMVGENDVRVTLDGGDEIPILDGSALPWMEAFLEHGADQKPKFVKLCGEVFSKRESSYGRIIPILPPETPEYTVHLDFEQHGFGAQDFRFRPGLDNYLQEIAPARTFAFMSDLQDLWIRGLAQGGDLNCALVIDENRVVNPEGERLGNEPARHKMLDAIGDLSLLGGLPFAKVFLNRPGHRLLHDLVSRARPFVESSMGDKA